MKKDTEWIAAKLEEENISAPASLSEGAVRKKLEKKREYQRTVNRNAKRRKRNRAFQIAGSLAACFAVILASVTAVNQREHGTPVPNTLSAADGIVTFSSYDEIEAMLKEHNEKMSRSGLRDFTKSAAGDEITLESASETGVTGDGDTALSFAQTNRQVAAVDEADIIKTDGKYIYSIPNRRNEIVIFSADGEDTALVSAIIPDEESREDAIQSLEEMFVDGDTLIAIGYRMTGDDYGVNGQTGSYTYVNTYDISDRAAPRLLNQYKQSGYYKTARRLHGCVYLITAYTSGYADDYKKLLPCATAEENGDYRTLPAKDICAVEEADSGGFAVIGAIDTESNHSTQTKAVLGVTDDIYCNESHLYLTGVTSSQKGRTDGTETLVLKYAVNKTDIQLQATGSVKGTTDNQFSLDEKDGNLRIATTSYSRSDEEKDTNHLFVLDENLKPIGKVSGFAKGEHIEAVRFVGDTAYVVTFVRTDPLFVIDLSDPTKPAVAGEVKLDGFSAFLTPVDDNTLLGIGFATEAVGEDSVGINGLKLVLFDVSDRKQPRVLDEKEFSNADSTAQYSHKALVRNEEKGYFAIPFFSYGSSVKSEYASGALVFGVKDGKLVIKDNCRANTYPERCTYIGDYLYLSDSEGEQLYAFLEK